MSIKNEYAILCISHSDSTPTAIVSSEKGQIRLRTNDSRILAWISGVCTDNYDAWPAYLESGSPIAFLLKSGYTALSSGGNPDLPESISNISRAVTQLSPIEHDLILYTDK